MRGGGELGLADDPLDRGVGPLAGRAAGAVGHRDEARAQAARASRSTATASAAIVSVLGGKNSKLTCDVAARLGEQGLRARRGCRAGSCRPPLALGDAGLRRRATGSRSARRLRDARHGRRRGPAAANQPAITSSSKPSRTCASLLAQFLALVRGEIDHQQGAAGREHPRRLGDRRPPASGHNAAPGG